MTRRTYYLHDESSSKKKSEETAEVSKVEFCWHNIRYVLEQKDSNESYYSTASEYLGKIFRKTPEKKPEEIEILRNVSGSFRSGEMTAILGPSGAGKTSLLNFLSQRNTTGYSGRLLLNTTNRRVRINAIPQEDNLLGYLTVRENLLFASRLNNVYETRNRHESEVERVSELLDLTDCLDTRTNNLSGGQEKRLAIAQEILCKPDVLILDEPTSGLDSMTCLKTLSVLHDIARQSEKRRIHPVAIILTIHQPQQEALDLFDKVYVMANGGRVIYNGPPGEIVAFVERHAGIKMGDVEINTASFLIDLASGEYGQEPIDALSRRVLLEFEQEAAAFTISAQDKLSAVVSTGNLSSSGSHMLEVDSRITYAKSRSNSGRFLRKTGILWHRCNLTLIREPKLLCFFILAHAMIPIFFYALAGCEPGQANACPRLFGSFRISTLVNSNDYISSSVKEEYILGLENASTIFFSGYQPFVFVACLAALLFIVDLNNSIRESSNGWYRMNSLMIARLISLAPLVFMLSLLVMALMFIVTCQNVGDGTMHIALRILLASCANAMSMFVGAIIGMICGAALTKDLASALFVAHCTSLPLVLISGFAIRIKEMSSTFRSLSYLSTFRYFIDVTYIARYGYNVCPCDAPKLTIKPEILGLSRKLSHYLDSTADINSDEETENSTSVLDLMAKQISLYNTYGLDPKTCDQVKPFHMLDLDLDEANLVWAFVGLAAMTTVFLVILFSQVNILARLRSSLNVK